MECPLEVSECCFRHFEGIAGDRAELGSVKRRNYGKPIPKAFIIRVSSCNRISRFLANQKG